MYIHIADPGFPEEPWPGERRMGPFVDVASATEQAVNDIATGFIRDEDFIGIFDDENSEMRNSVVTDEIAKSHGLTDITTDTFEGRQKLAASRKRSSKAAVPPSRIAGRVHTRRKNLAALSVADLRETEAQIKALLPKGVTMDDLIALGDQVRARRAVRAKEDAE